MLSSCLYVTMELGYAPDWEKLEPSSLRHTVVKCVPSRFHSVVVHHSVSWTYGGGSRLRREFEFTSSCVFSLLWSLVRVPLRLEYMNG